MMKTFGLSRRGTDAEGARGPANTAVFRLNIARLVLLIAAAALIAAGIVNGDVRDVFAKAAAICSECIGLG